MDNVSEHLRELDVLIKKKLFLIGSTMGIKTPPSPLQVKIFMYLISHKNDDVCQKDLEKSLKVSKVAISEALNKMENNGTIKRVKMTDDARSKKIVYTEEAIKKMNAMEDTLVNVNKLLVSDISTNDIKTFLKVVEQMKENVRKDDKDV